MAFGLSNQPFALKEGLIEIGTWATISQIGVDASDPLGHFSSLGYLGYAKQGSLDLQLTRQYVEAISGTPGKLLRKDLIRKQFTWMSQQFQVNVDLWKVVEGLRVQAAYAVTSPSAKTIDIGWIGSDEPTQLEYGFKITTALTDGTPFYIAIWNGKFTGEAIGKTLSGTDYATSEAKIEAFVNSTLADTDNYGMYWIDNT
jgi:hypothetical protein